MIPYTRLSLFYFVYFAGIGAFSPYFSLWLDDRGLSASAISLVMSFWYGTRVFAPSAWGHLTDRSAKPIAWLRIGCIATLACFALFLLPLPFAGLLVAMTLFAFFYNATMPQFEAITLSHLRDRPGLYGRIRLWGSVGFIGIVLGFGWAFDFIDVGWLPAMMLPIFAVLVLASYANDYARDLASATPPHDREAPSATPPHAGDAAPVATHAEPRGSVLAHLERPGVAPFLVLVLLMQVAHGAFYVFFALFLAEHDYRNATIGLFWATGVLAEIAMFWFAGSLLRRFGTTRAMAFCLGVAAVRFVATGVFAGLWLVIAVASLTHALTFGLFHAATMQRVTELFPPRAFGQGQGLLYGIGSGVGGVLGSLLAGAAFRFGGGRAAFIACGLVAAVGFVVGVQVARASRLRPAG